jgi:hypothetical protein
MASMPGWNGRFEMMFSTEFALEIRPEFLEDIGRHVNAELYAEL